MRRTTHRGLIRGAVLASLVLAGSSCSSTTHTTTNSASGCSASPGHSVTGGQPQPPGPGDITKIRHVILIIQENRSFDQYFGTYPGADGIPRQNGTPVVCVRDPKSG